MAAIKAVYSNLNYVKTRKCWIIGLEVPEEDIDEVTKTLGFPRQGESQWVGVALLDKSVCYNKNSNATEKVATEGEKLRTRAVLLCQDDDFVSFCNSNLHLPYNLREWGIEIRERIAKSFIYSRCGISSRSELATNTEAQEKFKQLLEQFKDWQAENIYSDNLNRY